MGHRDKKKKKKEGLIRKSEEGKRGYLLLQTRKTLVREIRHTVLQSKETLLTGSKEQRLRCRFKG